MTPQNSMTILLGILTIVGILKQARCTDPAEAVGGTLGILVRYGAIVAILWWGGFYGG